MKITVEWLNEQIANEEKNLETAKKNEWKELVEISTGALNAYHDVLFHKMYYGKTFRLYSKTFPKWKRKIIHVLNLLINKLEGVEKSVTHD